MRVLKTDMIILNTPEVVSDLLEKNSNIYCDRVSSPETCMIMFTLGPQPQTPTVDL